MLNDLRFAVRLLRKDFALTAMATLTLALGIGGTTTMFSAVHAALIRPLPYAKPDQLVMVWATQPFVNPSPMSGPDFLDYKTAKNFSHMSPIDSAHGYNLSDGDASVRVASMGVSADFFTMLDARPLLGRFFSAADEQLGGERTVILSGRLWRSEFGADPEIIGRSVSLDSEPYRVIGVADVNLHPQSTRTDLWLPFRFDPKTMNERGNHWLLGIGRLKEGVSQAQAKAELASIDKANAEKYPNDAHVGSRLIPLREQLYDYARAPLILLLAAAALLLLIACVNVANLLLSRCQKRRNEIAVRLALGASPARIVRQLLLESAVLATIGALAGVLLALWGTDALNNLDLFIFDFDQAGGATIDLPVLLTTIGITFVASLFFGLAPAIDAARTDLQSVLKEAAGRSSESRGRRRVGRALVVAELSLAVLLLAASGLTLLNINRLKNVDLGFDAHGILTFRLALPERRYDNTTKIRQFYENAQQKIATLPGVQSVSITNSLPVSFNDTNGGFEIEGRAPWEDGKAPLCEFLNASPDYFATAKVPFVLGRNFTAAEDKPKAGVVIINDTMEKAYWPEASPLGARIRFLDDESREIIGVVKETKRWGLDRPPVNEAYVPFGDWTEPEMSFMVRTALPPRALLSAIEHTVASIDSALPLYAVRTGEEHIGATMAMVESRLLANFLALFACVALLLAAIGVYGVVSYQLSQRRPEIAIRLALGGAPKQIQSLLLRETATVVIVASIVGAAGTLVVASLMRSMMFGASWRDLWIAPFVCAFLCTIALLATFIPARRSTSIDPNAVLRYE